MNLCVCFPILQEVRACLTRICGIVQHFKENPFFSDAVLKKVYKFVPSNAAADEKPDADGLTPSMEDFSWERDVVIEVSGLVRR